jgi:hypothetical protein
VSKSLTCAVVPAVDDVAAHVAQDGRGCLCCCLVAAHHEGQRACLGSCRQAGRHTQAVCYANSPTCYSCRSVLVV